MSQKNMEIVRRAVEHINCTGEPAWDLFDPEITFTTRRFCFHAKAEAPMLQRE